MTTRVLIADDHPVVRCGVRGALAFHEELEVVGEALNGDEALRLARQLQPDILLLDVNMPGIKAIQVLQEVKRSVPACRVLVLTAYSDTGTVLGMLKGGADGYLLKDEDPFIIQEAIRAIVDGQMWISQEVSAQLALIKNDETSAVGDTLTPREQDVLERIVAGNTNVEIAQALSLAERTVEFHVSNLLQKLGVRSRVEAAVWAKEHRV